MPAALRGSLAGPMTRSQQPDDVHGADVTPQATTGTPRMSGTVETRFHHDQRPMPYAAQRSKSVPDIARGDRYSPCCMRRRPRQAHHVAPPRQSTSARLFLRTSLSGRWRLQAGPALIPWKRRTALIPLPPDDAGRKGCTGFRRRVDTAGDGCPAGSAPSPVLPPATAGSAWCPPRSKQPGMPAAGGW